MNKPTPHISQYFKGGMSGTDSDQQLQPPNTYRYSLNGRILFNENGGFAWVNDKGNKFSFELKEYDGTPLVDYKPIGKANFSDKVVLFSTDGTNSEIGYVTFDDEGIGTYQQIFNDKYDPNGDLLNFSFDHNIEAHAVKETVDIERVYWVDNYNQDSVINIFRGLDFLYTPTLGAYPYWYSVQSLREYCDWKMGRIKYVQAIPGHLKTGVYQYSYRMGTKDGYRTPWYPLTRHFIHNSQDPTTVGNFNEYQMQPSNDVTPYGKKLEIWGVDNRFPILEVAYVYSISETQTVDAAIFYKETNDSRRFAPIETISHTEHSGDPIALDEFNIKWFPLRKSKTLEEKDSYLFKGNVTEVGVLMPDLTGASLHPVTRLMLGDQYETDRGDVPVTQVAPSGANFDIQNYTGSMETYELVDEFPNYKGTQFEHLFTSYWRGETYRFGVVLYDSKGMPNYVFHLDDFTFPEQYDSSGDFTLTELDGDGLYKIRIMGVLVDNIKIPADIVYDEFGNLNLSGFSIVRAKRADHTRHQGILLPTVFDVNATEVSSIAECRNTRPLPFTDNYFNGFEGATGSCYINNAMTLDGVKARGNNNYASRSGTFLYYSPEILFGEPTPVWENNDRFKLVGLATTPVNHQANTAGYNKIYGGAPYYTCHYYSKNYSTLIPTDVPGFNVPYELGDYSFIEENKIYRTQLDDVYKIENYDNINDDLIYTQFDAVDFADSGNDCSCCEIDKYSWGMPNSLLVLLKDFSNLGAGNDLTHNRVFISNFQRPNTTYFAGADENAVEKTLYIGTGHFQPINAAVIADTIDADGNLIFNGVEVYGGDCYPAYFDFTRLLPQYRSCSTNGGNDCNSEDCYEDYSVSMVVPLESNINTMMRYGRQFAKDGVQPEESACGMFDDLAKNGIQEKQREDFNYNSVLKHEENVQFFSAKPSDVLNRKENPLTVIYSQPKYYGEVIDNYRRYLANNFLDLTGANGSITELFAQYSYIYFLQTRGFGRLYINQPATIPSSEQGNIIVGSSGVLTGALYISQEVGCQHQFSVTAGHEQTYWVDVNLGKIYRFTQNGLDPLSDLKGQHNKIYNACKYYHTFDAPNGKGGIQGTYDYKNNEFILTFKRNVRSTLPLITSDVYNFTISYSENISAFVTFYGFTPRFYFNQQGLYFSDDLFHRGQFYVHLLGNRGEYYGILENSKLQLIVEPDLEVEKVYNGCRLNINADGVGLLSECQLVTEKDNILLSLPTDTRKRYRHNYLEFPTRGLTQTDRVRGKFLSETFTVANNGLECKITGVEHKFGIGYAI